MDTRYYQKINGSMFDFRDFYFSMAIKMPNNASIAEVGVADLKSVLYLAGALVELDKKFTIYAIDNLDYGGKDQLRTIINNAIKSGIPGVEVWPYSSYEAAAKLPDNHLDLVFIDASHEYYATQADIYAWYPKIKEGGFLAGHDYNSHDGVKMAVDKIIPKEIQRDPIVNENWNPLDPSDSQFQQTFEPEKFLQIAKTNNGNGVWWIQKKFYAKLN